MIGERPYAGVRTHEEALAELRRCAGTQFDAAVVEAFCRVAAEPPAVETNGSRSGRPRVAAPAARIHAQQSR